MATAGLRELRQHASELVRQAEAGEIITVTVSGRAVAQLGPVTARRWRRLDEIADIFAGPADKRWAADRELVDQTLRDPFDR